MASCEIEVSHGYTPKSLTELNYLSSIYTVEQKGEMEAVSGQKIPENRWEHKKVFATRVQEDWLTVG